MKEVLIYLRRQPFVKREATTTDVLIILRTLWSCARNIPCTGSDLVTFSFIILVRRAATRVTERLPDRTSIMQTFKRQAEDPEAET